MNTQFTLKRICPPINDSGQRWQDLSVTDVQTYKRLSGVGETRTLDLAIMSRTL